MTRSFNHFYQSAALIFSNGAQSGGVGKSVNFSCDFVPQRSCRTQCTPSFSTASRVLSQQHNAEYQTAPVVMKYNDWPDGQGKG